MRQCSRSGDTARKGEATWSPTIRTFHTKIAIDKFNQSNGLSVICNEDLRLMMMSCEDSGPYGPGENVATMFLEVFHDAIVNTHTSETDGVAENRKLERRVSISVYDVKNMEYPQSREEWDSYHGILLPGSFSAAYDQEEWIEKLKEVIRNEIHAKCRKTLGVCFGHQIFAHSFSDDMEGNDTENNRGGGLAVPCPAGTQVGIRTFSLTRLGRIFLNYYNKRSKQCSDLSLLYTHGDMVYSLPDFATNLGGTSDVPVQSAAYFESRSHLQQWLDQTEEQKKIPIDLKKPYAFTFQAHPEYASNLGLRGTFCNILTKLKDMGKVHHSIVRDSRKDAFERFETVQRDSINCITTAGALLRWI